MIYPDFIGKDPQLRIIADAKYKPFQNISGDDYLQLLAYMLRFDAKAGYYFYPRAERLWDHNKPLWLNRGTTYEKNVAPRDDIFVMKCGLVIPETAADYSDFRYKMERSENAFKCALTIAV